MDVERWSEQTDRQTEGGATCQGGAAILCHRRWSTVFGAVQPSSSRDGRDLLAQQYHCDQSSHQR